jgi:putative phosphoribosyl transferase
MIFRNRQQAGQILASRLEKYANREDVIVLGIPRGGVPVAFEVAKALNQPLDIFVLRKLGVPGYEELAFGAIGSGGVRVVNANLVAELGLSDVQVAVVIRAEQEELKRREKIYRGNRPPLEVRGRTVILIDDGIATGSSILAAIHALRQMQPAGIVVGTPVGPPDTVIRLQREVNELVCVEMPESFYGVGQFYVDFSQVSDQEVNELLDRAFQEDREQATPAVM